jgi:hypothetical protein
MTKYENAMIDVILNRELLMSRKIIDNNWNIGSLLPYYKDVDFTFKDKSPEEYNFPFLPDIMTAEFINHIWNEYQLVFIKGNR